MEAELERRRAVCATVFCAVYRTPWLPYRRKNPETGEEELVEAVSVCGELFVSPKVYEELRKELEQQDGS